jgi:ring-1,2-phenylacetyl-CoA epoxidase subunit PaaE
VSVRFVPLPVRGIERLTADSAAVTFAVPDALQDTFRFCAGQWLTVRRGDERRSYSICAPVGAAPRIGVREVAGGVVSGWLVRELSVGDVVEVLPPSGTFTPDLATPGDHVLIGAGSGITPLLSIASSVLTADETSTVTLLYGNRRSDTVMFVDELADLKDAHPTRMQIVHVLSREARDAELFSGRLDHDRLARLLPITVDAGSVHHWWLCGPLGLTTAACDVLAELGVDRARIHRELFWVGDAPPAEATHPDAPAGPGSAVTIVAEGRASTIVVAPGTAVLDAAQRRRPDLPFACRSGVCGTCRARVTSGSVRMRRNFALEPGELEQGYVLTCQALPASDEVTVDYDA